MTHTMHTSDCKMIYLARRNPALAPEAFPQAWREHSALGRQCKNVQDRVRSVTQCVRLLAPQLEGVSNGYDGVNLLGLRDRASADAIWTDPETLAIMRPDEPRVFDRYVRDFTLVAQEQVLAAEPPSDAVLVGFLKRNGHTDASTLEDALTQLSRPWTEVRRCVLNRVEPQRPPGYDFDAIVEWWFDDADQLIQALSQTPLPATLARPLADLIDPVASVFMATRVSHRRP